MNDTSLLVANTRRRKSRKVACKTQNYLRGKTSSQLGRANFIKQCTIVCKFNPACCLTWKDAVKAIR